MTPTRKFIRQAISMIVLILLIGLIWETIKIVGGDPWWADSNPFGWEFKPPFRWKFASDLNLPHLWDIFGAFSQPSRRNGPPLIETLTSAAFFTFREAIVGFVFGAVLGFTLGALFAHIPLMERGCMPYVVASQTVPILAIAPMVIIWLKAGWVSVAVISAYLTFFPVTINTLRGLKSPDPLAVDLMNSYAASKWKTLWKLRVPAALPYIFTALKISATASIVGAIIGELPSGIRDGLGGAILNFNQYYISGPGRLWATILISAIVGIVFFLLVSLAEWLVLRGRYRPVE
jgi:NitT/TauT family transport system permease protein